MAFSFIYVSEIRSTCQKLVTMDDVVESKEKNMWNATTLKFVKENLNERTEYLDLNTNHVSLECAEYIAKYLKMKGSPLIGLSLVQCHLTTRAAKVIFEAIGSSNLIEFYADNNILHQEACETLAASLQKNPPLEVLSLNGCNIACEGGIAIAQAIPSLTKLIHLRLESNNLFDYGAIAVAKAIKSSTFTHLSIADNEIWLEGSIAIVNEVANCKRIKSLDISYNTLDLDCLSNCITRNTELTELAISGCKIRINQLPNFLDKLINSNLTTLIMDGFDQNQLPVSWPKIHDKIFTQRDYFEQLLNLIQISKSLVDIRIGYLDPGQIMTMAGAFTTLDREVTLSIQDFGRTGNCWVAKFPTFELLAPTDMLKWSEPVTSVESARQFGPIFNSSKFKGNPLKSLDISAVSLNDQCAEKMLKNMRNINIDILELSSNNFGDAIVESLIEMCSSCKVRDLRLEKTRLSEMGLAKFLSYFSDVQPHSCPKELSFSVVSDDRAPLATHGVFQILAQVLEKGVEIESLCLDGAITPIDVMIVADQLVKKPVIHEFSIETDMTQDYSSPDPPIDPDILRGFADCCKSLHNLIVGVDESMMKDFKYPLLSEIFIYRDPDMLRMWQEIEARIEEVNSRK